MIPLPETSHAGVTLVLLAVVFFAFVREAFAPELVALTCLVILMVLGILPTSEAFALFGNGAVITIGSMFILSTALSKTGALSALSRYFLKMAHQGERPFLIALFSSAIPVSGIVNNTPLVAVLVPILKSVSSQTGIALSRLLIPASYATVLGGTLTLIGTSANLVVANSAKSRGLAPFGLFEISLLGLIYAAIGAAYMIFIGSRLLPNTANSHESLSSAETDPHTESAAKRRLALGTLLAITILAGLELAPIGLLTMAGALFVILTKCLSLEEAYQTIPWNLCFLIIGMLGLGMALETSGASVLIVESLIPLMGRVHPVVALSLVYLLTTILTEMVSNNAVAALLTPIAITLALQIDVDPRPFVVAVMFGASASFATPIGYQTNTYIYQLGHYRFTDFLKVGLPLNVILWGVATLMIPLIWPL